MTAYKQVLKIKASHYVLPLDTFYTRLFITDEVTIRLGLSASAKQKFGKMIDFRQKPRHFELWLRLAAWLK